MAYLALYRKYRPMTFQEVGGQKHLVNTIQNAIKNNKVAHAYLFCGPRGTGKTTVARLIAKAINCESEIKPCGKCQSCLEIQEGSHPDIVEIDAASNNGVDEIRDLIEKVKYSPIKAKYKVYIIDEVHMLTTNAFNALLKTLEDPPTHVKFILATTESHKVLPTIISRCQRFDFTKVDNKSLVERLEEVLKIENITYQPGLAEEVAILADGGMRDALSILDQLLAFSEGEITIKNLNQVYGLLSTAEKIQLIKDITLKNNKAVLDILEKIDLLGIDVKRLTLDLADILKETIIFQLTTERNLLNKITENQAMELLETSNKDKLLAMIDILLEASEKYRNVNNANIYFQTCLLKMLSVDSDQEKHIAITKQVEEKPQASEKLNQEIVEKVIEKVVSSTIEVDENLLQLLVRASKEKRGQLNNNWTVVESCCHDLEYARVANALVQSKPFAVGEDFVIVTGLNREIVDQINQEINEELNIKFMSKVTGSNKKVFAITKEHSTKLLEEFKTRGSQIKPAQLICFEKKNEEKEDETSSLTDLFGDIEVHNVS